MAHTGASAAKSPLNATTSQGRRIYNIEELMGNAHEIIIVHANQEYRLRVTRNNRLILTK